MFALNSNPIDVVSPKVYGLILDSRRLAHRLVPGGAVGSPYEIFDYRAVLVLDDPKGRRATFRRTQRVRFLQDGVAAIMDHLWGDGVILVDYHNTAGMIVESFKDQGTRHLVVDLKRPMARGEVFTFDVKRTAMEGFTEADEWLETTIDHPVQQYEQLIVFPQQRPCQRAELVMGEKVVPLEPGTLASGQTTIKVAIPRPHADTPYVIRWRW